MTKYEEFVDSSTYYSVKEADMQGYSVQNKNTERCLRYKLGKQFLWIEMIPQNQYYVTLEQSYVISDDVVIIEQLLFDCYKV